MKTAMQELIDSINMSYAHMTMAPETKDIYIYKIALKETLDKIDALLEKEKEQIIQPVDRLCDFYGHPHIGEQMYNTRYNTPILKPINNL